MPGQASFRSCRNFLRHKRCFGFFGGRPRSRLNTTSRENLLPHTPYGSSWSIDRRGRSPDGHRFGTSSWLKHVRRAAWVQDKSNNLHLSRTFLAEGPRRGTVGQRNSSAMLPQSWCCVHDDFRAQPFRRGLRSTGSAAPLQPDDRSVTGPRYSALFALVEYRHARRPLSHPNHRRCCSHRYFCQLLKRGIGPR